MFDIQPLTQHLPGTGPRAPAWHRRTTGALLAALVILAAAAPAPSHARITVAEAATENPTLLYDGAPLFKVGPLPEQAPFALAFGANPTFDHARWFDWMEHNRLGYGRVYPDSGFPNLHGVVDGPVPAAAPGRLYPFEVVRWRGGRPVVDLTRFSAPYWNNMARVIREAAERGIVLQIQLYQRAYFARRDNGWNWNFFHPDNNVNGFPVVPDDARADPAVQPADGYGLFRAMAADGPWRDVHRRWVEHVLDAVGDSGNVIIDLMNEGSFGQGISRSWIEATLDIVEGWERTTGRDVVVGMDFDHLYKEFRRSGDRQNFDYVLGHPRLDVLIAEGAESHVVPSLTAGRRRPLGEDLARAFRQRYRKPIVSTNSPSYGPHTDLEKLHLYQWYGLLAKVQGVGVYAKRHPLTFDEAPVAEYARRSRVLMQFFERITDYAALRPLPDDHVQAPAVHRLALHSPGEALLYVHAGVGRQPVPTGAAIELSGLELADGEVTLEVLDPVGGTQVRCRDQILAGALTTRTPFEAMDLALRIEPAAAHAGPTDRGRAPSDCG